MHNHVGVLLQRHRLGVGGWGLGVRYHLLLVGESKRGVLQIWGLGLKVGAWALGFGI